MRAAAQLYNAMGSIAESWLDVRGGEAARSSINRSISELEAAQVHLTEGLATIDALFTFLKDNWDEESESLLRASGFRGSLFILRDYKVHLETLQLLATPHIDALREAVQRLEASEQAKQETAATPFMIVRQISTRAMCIELMNFLQFEDDMSQTQLVNITRFAAADRFPS